MNFKRWLSVVSAFMILGAQQIHAQAWTSAYTSPTATGTCSGLSSTLNTEFAVAPVVSRALFPAINPFHIVKMTFWLNPSSGKTDIYMCEKGGAGSAGRVLYYNGTANTLTAIGTVPNVYIGFQEQGVIGIALNPKTFSQDNLLYIMYATGSSGIPSATNGWRISRFKLNPSTKMIDLASEKILLHIPAGTANRWHTAGSMQFDNFGNLYVAVGDNESEAMGPANTADLRGGILRIKPDSTTTRGYTIPAGNFGDYWANQWQSQGLATRAAAYRDTAIVKSEIYVKGTRNPYGSSLDRNRLGWVAWGECGPDVQRSEEYDFVTHPVFGGWPFWAGNAVRQGALAASYDETPEPNTSPLWTAFNPTTMSTSVPVNNWAQAKGYDTLPPMHVPTYTEQNGCATGAAVIRYDGRISNPGKMPPHLDNTVLYTNQTSNGHFAVKFDPVTAGNVGTVATVFTSVGFRSTAQPLLGSSLDLQQGPDGAIYSVNWGAGCCDGDRAASAYEGVSRVTYTGTCQDSGLYPATTSISRNHFYQEVDWFKMGGNNFFVLADGMHEIRILQVNGSILYAFKGEGRKKYEFPVNLSRNNLYYLEVKTERGVAIRGFLRP